MMWSRLRASKMAKVSNEEKFSSIHRSFNVHEEYLSALRTQSYAEFCAKAQLVVTESSSTPRSMDDAIESLLEPEQDAIPSALETLIFPEAMSDLKLLVSSYFDTSAQASKICSHLLRSINHINSNYQSIQRVLERFGNHSPKELNSAVSELHAFTLVSNPFSNRDQHDFKGICDRYSSILQHLKSKRKTVARRIKLIECINKASGICLTVACGVVALVAIGIAVHSLTGLLMGPALLGFPPVRLKKNFSNLEYFQSKFLRKLGEQLDVAGKGTYILSRDFDTVSRLVARLCDEVEHNKAMIRFCLERREDRFPLHEVVKELKKSGHGFQRQVDELEEHVCLRLVTINKARVLVMKEIAAT